MKNLSTPERVEVIKQKIRLLKEEDVNFIGDNFLPEDLQHPAEAGQALRCCRMPRYIYHG